MCPRELREQAYFALVRSRLEYAAAIWDPHLQKDVSRLEAVQRRGARFALKDHQRTSCVTNMLKELGWLALKDRRRDIRLALLYQIVKGKVAVQAEDTLVTSDPRTRRNHDHNYRHLSAKTTIYRNSYFPRTIPEWNSLSGACVNAGDVTAFCYIG